jgi:hypothetical protein
MAANIELCLNFRKHVNCEIDVLMHLGQSVLSNFKKLTIKNHLIIVLKTTDFKIKSVI